MTNSLTPYFVLFSIVLAVTIGVTVIIFSNVLESLEKNSEDIVDMKAVVASIQASIKELQFDVKEFGAAIHEIRILLEKENTSPLLDVENTGGD